MFRDGRSVSPLLFHRHFRWHALTPPPPLSSSFRGFLNGPHERCCCFSSLPRVCNLQLPKRAKEKGEEDEPNLLQQHFWALIYHEEARGAFFHFLAHHVHVGRANCSGANHSYFVCFFCENSTNTFKPLAFVSCTWHQGDRAACNEDNKNPR